MKKLALLSAVMTLGISSWAFAADNPPPPPEKGAQHQGKPLAKNGQHDGKQAQHNGKQPQRDGKQPQHGGKQPQRDGKQPPKGGEHSGKPLPPKALPLRPGLLRQAFFHLLSADIDKLLPFFEKPRKKPAQRLA